MKQLKAAGLFFFSILYFLLISTNSFAADGIKWHAYSDGIEFGKKHNQKVFLYFYSEQCRYCAEMENKTFKSTSVIENINKHFIPVKVNTDKEKDLTFTYRVRGLPSIYFISEKGEVVTKYPGYMPPDMILIALKHVYTDSYKTMSIKSYMDTIGSSEK